MEITVKNGAVEVASGDLEVTAGTPPSATFTPTDGSQATCTGVVWNAGPNGVIGFNFQVSGQANGDFPCGANGNAYTYRFTGRQNANGSNPSGNVNFPSTGIEDDDNDTWQAGAAEDEPYAQTQTAG